MATMRGGVPSAILGCVLWLFTVSHLGLCLGNLALHKPASMSPHDQGVEALDASGAVDGETANIYPNDACVRSIPGDPKPWVVVDLLKEYSITDIFLINRLDCCAHRTHDFIIDVFKTNPVRCPSAQGSVCMNYDGVFGNEGAIECDTPVLGRFVRIWKPLVNGESDVLNFCEMEVFGQPKDPAAECGPTFVPLINYIGKRLVSSNVMSLSVSSKVACVVECETFGACVAGNYSAENGVCELLTRPEYNAAVSTDPTWVYFGHDFC